MCLAIPAKIVAIKDAAQHLVLVEQAGIPMEIDASVLLASGKSIESLIDQWVLLHQGFAMQQISSEEALSILDAFNALSDPKNGLGTEERRQHPLPVTQSHKMER